MFVTVPELDHGASDLTADLVHVALLVSPSVKVVGATETAKPGFIGEEIQPPMVGEFNGGRSTRLRRPGKVVSSPQWHQGATLNHFSPLLGLGNEMNFCFGERKFYGGVMGEGRKMEHGEVNPSAFSQGEEESGLLECSPLSKWDPKEHKELEVIQEVDEGEVRGSEAKNLKWVCSLMKSFCKIVGFPIVKHEDQCLALFRLLEQDYFCLQEISSKEARCATSLLI